MLAPVLGAGDTVAERGEVHHLCGEGEGEQ